MVLGSATLWLSFHCGVAMLMLFSGPFHRGFVMLCCGFLFALGLLRLCYVVASFSLGLLRLHVACFHIGISFRCCIYVAF